MKIFALELSTHIGSLAILDGDILICEKDWVAEGRQLRPIFPDIHALASAGTWDWAEIDCFAVGVGPGAFSGLRMAVAGIRGLAIPDNKPVIAVSSASALAWSILKETGAEQVAVLGDARRQELWAGCFGWDQGQVARLGDWIVAVANQLPQSLESPGTVWVTPDWERLRESLTTACPAGVTLIQEARIPRATMVAGVAAQMVQAGAKGESLSPIYVHPAVSVAPRF